MAPLSVSCKQSPTCYKHAPALTTVFILHSTSGRYDLIGFDPRGIANTRPLVSCFPSTRAYEEFKAATVLERGFDIPHDPHSEEGYNHLLDQHRQLMALQEAEFAQCNRTMDDLQYMGTSTVVRDIDRMSTILYGPEAPINFFGASYGTILGAYLVNQLDAKRIGRVLIDGVASAPQWANRAPYLWLHDWLSSTEDTYSWFLSDCSKAGPKSCPLATSVGEDPDAIDARLMAYLDKLYTAPVPVINTARPGVLTSGAARSVLYSTTNGPGMWPRRAEIFAKALAGDATELYEATVQPFDTTGSLGQTDLSRAAVACADSLFLERKDWPTAEDMVNRTYYNLQASPRFGASVGLMEPDGGCQFHPASGRAPERFTGPWNNTLSTKMLIVSNTHDPITPLTSGRELNTLMGDSSTLLVQKSAGHCSLGSVSVCTQRWYRRYFVDGLLPDDETLCEIDKGYFPADAPAVNVGRTEEEKELAELSEKVAAAWNVWALGG